MGLTIAVGDDRSTLMLAARHHVHEIVDEIEKRVRPLPAQTCEDRVLQVDDV